MSLLFKWTSIPCQRCPLLLDASPTAFLTYQ
jgi:hypothetical protein